MPSPHKDEEVAEKLMEKLKKLRNGEKFNCLKKNEQKIWEEGYAGQVLNKFAGSEQAC